MRFAINTVTSKILAIWFSMNQVNPNTTIVQPNFRNCSSCHMKGIKQFQENLLTKLRKHYLR